MTEDKVKHIMAQVKAFPAMPTTATKLLKLCQNPDTTVSQIEEIVRYDAGLTANILKLTNSAYFGLPSKISSVKQAVLLLGWKRLLQLVMTMCMSSVMKKRIVGYDMPDGELWRHSIAVSVAAEILVKALKIPHAEDVFTAALLHDVGKLVLGSFVRDDLQQIEAMVAKGIGFEVAEYMVLGTDHAEVGAKILEKWGFPVDLVNAVGWHHDPQNCEVQCMLSDIVHTANILGLMIGSNNGKEEFEIEPSNEVTDRLGLEPVLLEDLAAQTKEGFEKIAGILSAN